MIPGDDEFKEMDAENLGGNTEDLIDNGATVESFVPETEIAPDSTESNGESTVTQTNSTEDTPTTTP